LDRQTVGWTDEQINEKLILIIPILTVSRFFSGNAEQETPPYSQNISELLLIIC